MAHQLIQIMAEAQGSLSVTSRVFCPNSNGGLGEGMSLLCCCNQEKRSIKKVANTKCLHFCICLGASLHFVHVATQASGYLQIV